MQDNLLQPLSSLNADADDDGHDNRSLFDGEYREEY
jgi:hypothetical protein